MTFAVYWYLFWIGSSILSLELAAARLFVPYFGSSVFVWGSSLSVVMATLAFGYYQGGKLADKKGFRATESSVMTITAAFWIMAMPTVVPRFITLLGSLPGNGAFGFFASTIITSVLVYGLPMTLLAAVSPIVLKTYIKKVHEIGEKSGLISAVGTMGSIMGAVSTSYVLIPGLGTQKTFYVIAFGLLAASFVYRFHLKTIVTSLGAAVILMMLGSIQYNAKLWIIAERESAYQYIYVMEIDGRKALITDQGRGVQTLDPDENGFAGGYSDLLAMSPLLLDKDKQETKKILVVGTAGGAVIKQLRHFFPDDKLAITAVEIDPAMIEFAREYFEFDDQTTVVIQDGRVFFNTLTADQHYDIVIVDAFANELYVPFHLTTVEFFEKVKKHLSADGFLAMNMLDIHEDPQDLATYITSSTREVFPYTYKVQVGRQARVDNQLVFASTKPMSPEPLLTRSDSALTLDVRQRFITNWSQVQVNDKNLLLTDDKAPVEFITARSNVF